MTLILHLIGFTIVIGLLGIYPWLYWQPKLDINNKGEWILWYTETLEVSPGIFNKKRRFLYLAKYKL